MRRIAWKDFLQSQSELRDLSASLSNSYPDHDTMLHENNISYFKWLSLNSAVVLFRTLWQNG